MARSKVVQLIWTTERRGLGRTDEDPIRLVPQLWTLDGRLVAAFDAYGSNPGPIVDEHVLNGLDAWEKG